MMSKIVRTITNMLYVFILIFGFYIIMHGHLTPGGGFQGGAVVASGIALVLIAYGYETVENWIKKSNLSVLESIGGLAFIGVAFLGIGTTFFYNFLANAGGLFGNPTVIGINPGDLNTSGVLPIMSWAVGLKVLAGLGSIVLLIAYGIRKGDEK
ncbi:MAG: Na(+)/H(+) antiporter subunit B [Methanomicrobia archaeon]|nr:Na(+)/H(+) antiporter subunit B [Methanomicrobia archaeon]